MAAASASSGSATHHTRFCRFSKEASDAGSSRSHCYEYDVYIFYEIEDHEFVFQHIVSHLDNDFSGAYKCCYEIKDFLPGSYYVDAVVEAMKRSYWTFLVFSKTSVGKGYAKFLYHQTIHSARNLVPVKIDDCKVPEELENIKTVLDFTLMSPEVFHERLASVISVATAGFISDTRPTVIGKWKVSAEGTAHQDGPADSEAVYADGCRSRASPQEPSHLDARQLNKSDTIDGCKSSAESFHDNPEQYIESFQKTNLQSPIFRKFEGTLLRDILPEAHDWGDVECVSTANLVRLTCCPSPVVKRRALGLLEARLVRDDLRTASSAHGLMETEELLRLTLLDKPFTTETADFQSARLRVYGRLLFYVAMHIEKKHLTFDLARSKSLLLVKSMATELLKQIRKLSYTMTYALLMVHHGQAYLEKLMHDMESGLSEDKISERINELGKVTDLCHFTPWYHLRKALRSEQHWVYLDVILSYVGNLAFRDSRYVQVLLRHIPDLLQPYPFVRKQVSSGVLLNIAQMLVSLIVHHDRRDIRMSAFFGLNSPRNCPGLTSLWNFHLYNTKEFQIVLQEVVEPLLITAPDLEVRQTIYKVFFECAYLQPSTLWSSNGNDPLRLEESLILSLVQKHLTSQYERIGDRLQLNSSHTTQHTNAHIIEGCFNYTTSVAVKIPRIKSQGPLTNLLSHSATQQLLLDETAVLETLSHENVLRLIGKPSADFVPVHVVVEYMNGGNLLQHLQRARTTCRSPVRACRRELVEKVLQVGAALVYLAEEGVVHRDICAYNVLLHYPFNSREGQVKLAGFSLARRVQCAGRLERAVDTSPDDGVLLRWSDPRSLLNGVWCLQTDVWMFWCLVFEVFTYGTHPFPECLSAIDVPNMVGLGYSLQQPLCMPSDMHVLIQRGLNTNIQKRGSIQQAIGALRDLAQDWAYADVAGQDPVNKINFNVKYPDCPHEGIQRMSPQDFQAHQLSLRNTHGPGTKSTSQSTYVDFKLLQAPDLIDPSEADQPRETMRRLQGRFVPMNNEVFKATPERQQVMHNLVNLSSENVCKIFEFNTIGNEATLLTELDTGGGVLAALLHHPAVYGPHHVVHLVLQMLEGLQHLHTKHHVVHTDLRAQYLYAGAQMAGLPQGYFKVKIGRLARCKMLFKGVLDKEGRTIDTKPIPIDSLRWAPPEVLQEPAYYSRGSDVYSVGLVLWQLLYALQVGGHPDPRLLVPHPDWPSHRLQFHRRLLLGVHPEQPAHCPDWMYVLIKMCLRDRYKRPTIDLLQDALTSRTPFNSKLLEGIKTQLSNSEFQPPILFGEEQAADAPYLGWYRDPLTGPAPPSCLNPDFYEGDHFYLRHARFGFHVPECDQTALMRAPSGSASPETSLLQTSRLFSSQEEEQDFYDFKDTYDDCISYPEPDLDDSSRHYDAEEEEEEEYPLYESINPLDIAQFRAERPNGPSYHLESPQPQSLQQENPYLVPEYSVEPRRTPKSFLDDQKYPQCNRLVCQPNTWSSHPAQGHCPTEEGFSEQFLPQTSTESVKPFQVLGHPNTEYAHRGAPLRDREGSGEPKQIAAAFIHSSITDTDDYSLVTKTFIQHSPPREPFTGESVPNTPPHSIQRNVRESGELERIENNV